VKSRHEVPEVFGRRIQRERQRRAWNLRELGDKAGGVSANTILRVEDGQNLTLGVAVALAKALGVSLDSLLAEVECETCDGMPPAGFICAECGRGAKSSTDEEGRGDVARRDQANGETR
jgi:transcriptional regulator with XRE-family HTH domain